MAERRMFAKAIIDSDIFLDMPVTARLLYYDLAMRADDDGFINAPKKIMRMIGASQDDLNILILRKFIIPFETGIVVIKHWRIHNYIQNDRYKETIYQNEKGQLSLNNKVYEMAGEGMDTDCIQNVSTLETQSSLGKSSLGKSSLDYNKKEKSETGLDVIINNYTQNAELINAIYDFIKFRKAIKAPLTDRALQLNLNKLDKMATDEGTKTAIINQSIERGWKSFYNLKEPEQEKEAPADLSKYDFVINNF